MRQPLRSLRRRRERGRQRVALVTAGSAAGATALAATFGAVLAAGQAPPAHAAPDTSTTAPVNAAAPVDQVAVDKAVRQPLPAEPRPTPTAIAPPPRPLAPVAAPAAKASSATRQPERHKPTERASRGSAKSTAQAPTGAS